jgi:hypothetical protein
VSAAAQSFQKPLMAGFDDDRKLKFSVACTVTHRVIAPPFPSAKGTDFLGGTVARSGTRYGA